MTESIKPVQSVKDLENALNFPDGLKLEARKVSGLFFLDQFHLWSGLHAVRDPMKHIL